ncbi:MAG: hypothetical protein ACI4QM_00595 [Alphaproteobacteria bacterium]
MEQSSIRFDNAVFADLSGLIGCTDTQGRRQGRYRGFARNMVQGDVFITADYENGDLRHIRQYTANAQQKHVKYLDCEVVKQHPRGFFYYDDGVVKWDGRVDEQGNFSGWCHGASYQGFYICGLKHGQHIECDCQTKKVKMVTYDHGYTNGPFFVRSADEHVYGYHYIADGQVHSKINTISAKDYPLLKKMGLFALAAALYGTKMMSVMHRKFHQGNNVWEKGHYRR